MCSPTSGGGPWIRPGVSEKSIERAELAHAAEQRVVVLGDEAEPLVVGVEQHALAALGVDRDLVGHAGGVEDVRPDHRRARREARLQQRLELPAVLRARRARREPLVGGEVGHAERGAQRLPVRVLERGDLDPAFLRLVQAVQRVGPGLGLVEPGPGHGLAVDEQRVGGEHRSAVEQRGPQLLALAAHPLVVERRETPDHRQHRVGGVGHAEAQVVRSVALAHRTLLVLEPGRRLVERIEPAEVRERALEAVRPRVAVDDLGLHALAVVVADAEPHRDARGHVVVHDVGALHELERDLEPARLLEIECDAALAALATEERPARHAHAVTGDRLDLDHVGAEIADHHRAERAGEVLAEVDQPHTFERVHHATPVNFAMSAAE